MTLPRVLITGARGFVGEALAFRLLRDKKFCPVAATRGPTRLQGLCPVVAFDLVSSSNLPVLNNIQVVVHAAARVHVMTETVIDALAEFRKINVEGTLNLAKHAAASGVKRFIFISSIKVNGERTARGIPYKADDVPSPLDPYAVSKYEAEEALKVLGACTGMEVVIIRPPLVYGPGVKANFLSLLRWLDRGIPLPLGAIDNQRSLVAIGNLVDLIVVCISHPAAAGNVFLVSDGDDLSTTQLLYGLASALELRPRLLPIPAGLLKLTAALLGKKLVIRRLCESLQVDISKNHELLGWIPPINVSNAMRQTANHYLELVTK